jgi:hypothetical protein
MKKSTKTNKSGITKINEKCDHKITQYFIPTTNVAQSREFKEITNNKTNENDNENNQDNYDIYLDNEIIRKYCKKN